MIIVESFCEAYFLTAKKKLDFFKFRRLEPLPVRVYNAHIRNQRYRLPHIPLSNLLLLTDHPPVTFLVSGSLTIIARRFMIQLIESYKK